MTRSRASSIDSAGGGNMTRRSRTPNPSSAYSDSNQFNINTLGTKRRQAKKKKSDLDIPHTSHSFSFILSSAICDILGRGKEKGEDKKSLSRQIRMASVLITALSSVLTVGFVLFLIVKNSQGGIKRNRDYINAGICHGHSCKESESKVFGSIWPSRLGWDEPLQTMKCRKTKFHPHSEGLCPSSSSETVNNNKKKKMSLTTVSSCVPQHRTDVSKEEPLYRAEVLWDFGPELKRRSSASGAEIRDGTKGLEETDEILRDLFPRSSSTELPRSFLGLERELLSKFSSLLSDSQVSRPDTIHITLFYLCCLTATEVNRIHEIVKSWVSSRPKDSMNVPITFDRVECWKEQMDTVKAALIADRSSQRKIHDSYYQEGIEVFKKAGIPTPVRRDEQMPFHAELSTVHGVSSKDNLRVAGSINTLFSPHQRQVASITGDNQGVTRVFGTNVTFGPKFSTRVACHSNCHGT